MKCQGSECYTRFSKELLAKNCYSAGEIIESDEVECWVRNFSITVVVVFCCCCIFDYGCILGFVCSDYTTEMLRF